ncbi:MAG: hypothetical protein ACTSRG_25905, partial [Candidatus Helarchaeota archaeon]
MHDFLSKYEIQPDSQVGKLPLKIDLVIKYLQKPAKHLIPLLEDKFSRINLFEYKSSYDAPKKNDLPKLIGYLGLYCDQHKIGIDRLLPDVTLWYISVNSLKFLKKLVTNNHIIATENKALYELNIPFPCPYYIMIINELEIIEENVPLLLLSSGDTLKNTIRLIARKNITLDPKLEKYLCLMYYMNY